MVHAIYPTGVTAEYASANHMRWRDNGTCLLYQGDPDNGGRFIARIPADCIVSFDRPASVEHKGKPPAMTLDAALKIVAAGIESCDAYYTHARHLRTIKKKLRKFDSRTGGWEAERA